MDKFIEMGLSESLLTDLEKKGFKEPTPVQAEVIPYLLDKKGDLIAKAQTGTG